MTTMDTRPPSTIDRQCSGIVKATGKQCKKRAIKGGTVCRNHGGASPNTARKALVRAEIADWGLTDVAVDPGETLLRLVSQSARRAEFYAGLLREAYEQAQIEDEARIDGMEALSAPALRGILVPSGVRALIGKKYTVTTEGARIETGEAIRGLAELEMRERVLCAGFATKAIAAGLAERQVRVAEQQGAALIAAVMYALERQGITGPALLTARNDVADFIDGNVA